MPRLTTARIGRPVAPTRKPPRTCAASVFIRACAARMSAHDVAAVDDERRVARLAQRRVQRRPALRTG